MLMLVIEGTGCASKSARVADSLKHGTVESLIVGTRFKDLQTASLRKGGKPRSLST
jgi:hypothetical protein